MHFQLETLRENKRATILKMTRTKKQSGEEEAANVQKGVAPYGQTNIIADADSNERRRQQNINSTGDGNSAAAVVDLTRPAERYCMADAEEKNDTVESEEEFLVWLESIRCYALASYCRKAFVG